MASRGKSCSYSDDISAVCNQMDKVDGKKPLVIGPIAFFASAFLGLPFWLTVLLPFTIFSVIGYFALVLIFGRRSSTTADRAVNAEEEKVTKITPTHDRKYDLILLGVTGFTGKLAAAYLAEQYGGESSLFLSFNIVDTILIKPIFDY